MKWFLRFGIIYFLLISTAFALPANRTLTWDPPTTYSDGTPLLDSGIGGYFIYWRTSSQTTFIETQRKDVGKVLSYDAEVVVGNLLDGGYCFTGSTYRPDGVEGPTGNVICKWYTNKVPSAPIIVGEVQMANNFSGDTNAKALWRLEETSGTRYDSLSTNNLTDNNTVTQDTINYKEGVASADFESTNSEYLSVADASLVSGFPLKNGDTNKVISVCAWVRLESAPSLNTGMVIFSKYDSTNTKRSFMLAIYTDGTNTHARGWLGYNSGASFENIIHTSTLSPATWYHVTMTYNNADKSYGLYIRDTSGNTIGSDLTGTATLDVNKLSVSDPPVYLGAVNPTQVYFMDGLLDEVVVFNDIITAAEATQIAKGLYMNNYSGKGIGRGILRGAMR